MQLYNALTRQKEQFIPITPGEVKIYCCGPTVYNLFHVGNARTFVVFDVLRRYMEYSGLKVRFAQNFTDIDDKIIRRAAEENADFRAITERYIQEYFTDAHGLGIHDATVHPKATENIQGIQELVQTLVDKSFAYVRGGDVYFRTEAYASYGRLSRQPLEDLEAGARIEVGEDKENPMDFALWKSSKPGEPAWDSPWGPGRPGWHIECSAMVRRYLGDTIDIHGGGQDLIFPHHENEMAQSEAATGQKFANFWMYVSFLNVDNHKMGKSEGNFFMTRDAAVTYGYEAIRMFLVSAQYRSPLNFSADGLTAAKASLQRLRNAERNLLFLAQNAARMDMDADETAALASYDGYRERFCAAMDDDLNTADALGVIFELVREINTRTQQNPPAKAFAEGALALLRELCGVLGLLERDEDADLAGENADLAAEVEDLIEKRAEARKNRDFKAADAIRDGLKARGILLEDTPQGVKWRRV